MRFKKVMRLDTIQRHYRLFRLLWTNGKVGDGNGYSAKLSVGLIAKLFSYTRLSRYDISLTVMGLRLHYARAYGGIIV